MSVEIAITSVRITILSAIGALTQSRVDHIKAAFGAELPNTVMPPGGGVVVLSNAETGYSVFLANGDFAVEAAGFNIVPDLHRLEDYASRVVNALLLDRSCRAIARLTSLVPSSTGDAMSQSLQCTRYTGLPTEWGNPVGAGMRLFYGVSAPYSEIKIEPFIADAGYFYSEYTYSIAEATDLAKILDKVGARIEEYRANLGNILKEVFKNS